MGIKAILVNILESTIEKIKTAPGKSQVLKTESFPGDTLSPELYQTPGIFSRAPKGSKGIFIPLAGSRSVGAVVGTNNYKIEHDIKTGELIVYSSNAEGDTIKASIYFKDDGNIELNGNGDNAVRYSKLETAFNKFVEDFEAHSHEIPAGEVIVSVSGGSGSAATGTPNPFPIEVDPIDVETDADIEPAKIEEIEVPS